MQKSNTEQDYKGLASECKELGEELGIRDVRFYEVTKGEINRAIRTQSWNSRSAEMAGSTKVGDRVSDNPKDNSYMTLNDSRLWMRLIARMMNGVKMNHKSSNRKDFSCSFCNGPMEESQEHLEEECSGCDFERRTLKIHTLRGRQTFWRRMKAKIEEKIKKKKEKGEGVAAVAGVGRVHVYQTCTISGTLTMKTPILAREKMAPIQAQMITKV